MKTRDCKKVGKPHPPHDRAQRLQLRPAPSEKQRCQKCVPTHPIGRRQIGKQPRMGAQLQHFAPSHKGGLPAAAGRRHRVHGGIAVIDGDGRLHARVVTTAVVFKRLSHPEIDAYIESGEWRDKAGAYALQGAAAAFVPKIIGSYSNVVGLALAETAALLHGLGYQREKAR